MVLVPLRTAFSYHKVANVRRRAIACHNTHTNSLIDYSPASPKFCACFLGPARENMSLVAASHFPFDGEYQDLWGQSWIENAFLSSMTTARPPTRWRF